MQEEMVISMRPFSFEELDRTPESSSHVVGAVANHDEAERISDRVDDDDFEFTFEGIDRDSEWFPPGEVFPIFDRRLLSEADTIAIENDQMQLQTALKKLFIVDDDPSNNTNNQPEESELNGVASESYCVWTPGNSPQASPARCKKSSSTGTRRWGVSSLKELLIRRSRSDGKNSLVRFGPCKKHETAAVVDAKKSAGAAAKSGGGEKRRATYLPYRKAIIGFGFYPSG